LQYITSSTIKMKLQVAVQKVLVIRKMQLPDEICDEIISYLFYEIMERTNAKKRELNEFIKHNIIRYEEYNITTNMCVWGLSFFPYDNARIQNMNCTICGDFLFSRYEKKTNSQHKSCKCIL
jgi:hypothetical protein